MHHFGRHDLDKTLESGARGKARRSHGRSAPMPTPARFAGRWAVLSVGFVLWAGCGGGAATAEDGDCTAPLVLCGDSCTSPLTDPNNCGVCGTVCAGGETCSSGACGGLSVQQGASVTASDGGTEQLDCPSGETACLGVCANLATSFSNCGSCGYVCAAGESCVAGGCVQPCPSGQTACSGSCEDLETSTTNCGGCGIACNAGESCCSGSCVSGTCQCAAPGAPCSNDALCCSGTCSGGSCQ